MNLPNRITIVRIVLSILLLVLLIFPFDMCGISFPIFHLFGSITVSLQYIIGGVIFLVASLTDFLDGNIARKKGLVTDFGKVMVAGGKGKAVGASILGKLKTICMMTGLTLVFFYNIPFELLNVNVAEGLLYAATVLSIISGVQYYIVNKEFFKEK